jgi:hypothetical protein
MLPNRSSRLLPSSFIRGDAGQRYRLLRVPYRRQVNGTRGVRKWGRPHRPSRCLRHHQRTWEGHVHTLPARQVHPYALASSDLSNLSSGVS